MQRCYFMRYKEGNQIKAGHLIRQILSEIRLTRPLVNVNIITFIKSVPHIEEIYISCFFNLNTLQYNFFRSIHISYCKYVPKFDST